MPQPVNNLILSTPTFAQNPLSSVTPGQLTSTAYWTWGGTTTNQPYVQYYFNQSPTKTGLLPSDLKDFIGVPAVINTLDGTVPTPVPDTRLFQLLRQAEDWVETESGILLAQAWVASPPVSAAGALSIGMSIQSQQAGQVWGVDYDIMDPGYDFFYRRFLMEGWGVQQLRYRPLKTVVNYSFIYPLLSEFFDVPRSWIVEDWDAGIIRIVPAANVQMLPLFAMQLSFMGFAQSLPQGLYLQYVAGLNQTDYSTRFNFMKLLVLSAAAVYLLPILQGSINFGQTRRATSVDGLRYDVGYPSSGAAYGGLIQQFTNQRDTLMRTAIDLVRGAITMISL